MLIGAELGDSDLTYADFRDSHLIDVNLRRAKLRGADLSSMKKAGGFTVLNLANLEGADLEGADLRGILAEDTDFRNANLTGANFSGAVLSGAIFRRANVTDADFSDVELASVTMDYANFSKARNAEIPPYKQRVR